MRLYLELESRNLRYIELPLQYNHLVQGMIYDNLSDSLANFLHEIGFTYGKRRFKLFTFSRILGRMRVDDGKAIFKSPVKLAISSPIDRFVKELSTTLLKRGVLSLGGTTLCISNMSFPKCINVNGEVEVRMLSPVTVYSTLYTPEGMKKTYYYSPYETEFSRLIEENAKKKYYLLHKRLLKRGGLRIELASPRKSREVIVLYKGTVIKGWMGRFILKGAKSLIKTLYETGLGSKNPQGFGMFEVI